MTLDGRFLSRMACRGLVSAHEWIQMYDGMMEAGAVDADLSAAASVTRSIFSRHRMRRG